MPHPPHPTPPYRRCPWVSGEGRSDCEGLVAAEPGLEPVELGPEHGRHLVGTDLVEPLLDLGDLGAPLGRDDGERFRQRLDSDVQP